MLEQARNDATPATTVKTQPHIARQEKNNGLKLARVAASASPDEIRNAITSTQTKKAVGITGVIPKVPECRAGYCKRAKTIKRKLNLKLTRPSATAALLFIINLCINSRTKKLEPIQKEKP